MRTAGGRREALGAALVIYLPAGEKVISESWPSIAKVVTRNRKRD